MSNMMELSMMRRNVYVGLIIISALFGSMRLEAVSALTGKLLWTGLSFVSGGCVGAGLYARHVNSQRAQEKEGQRQLNIACELEQANTELQAQMPKAIVTGQCSYRDLTTTSTRTECAKLTCEIERMLEATKHQTQRASEVTGKNGATSTQAWDKVQQVLPKMTGREAELRAYLNVLVKLRTYKFEPLKALHESFVFMKRLEPYTYKLEALDAFVSSEYGSRKTSDQVMGLPFVCAAEDLVARRQAIQANVKKLEQHSVLVGDIEATRAGDTEVKSAFSDAARCDQLLLYVHNALTSRAEFRKESAEHHDKRLAMRHADIAHARAKEDQAHAEKERRRAETEKLREQNDKERIELEKRKVAQAIAHDVASTAIAMADKAKADSERARAEAPAVVVVHATAAPAHSA